MRPVSLMAGSVDTRFLTISWAALFQSRFLPVLTMSKSAPPLAILPLAAREMKQWLEGGQNRAVVLHCKGAKP